MLFSLAYRFHAPAFVLFGIPVSLSHTCCVQWKKNHSCFCPRLRRKSPWNKCPILFQLPDELSVKGFATNKSTIINYAPFKIIKIPTDKTLSYQIGKTSVAFGALLPNSKLTAQRPPDELNSEATLVIRNNLPSACPRLYRPNSLTIPQTMSTIETHLQLLVAHNSSKCTPLNSTQSQTPLHLRRLISCANISPTKPSLVYLRTNMLMWMPPTLAYTRFNTEDLRQHLCWLLPVSVDLDEIHFISPNQPPRGGAHPNFPTASPQTSNADGKIRQMIALSPMLCHAHNPIPNAPSSPFFSQKAEL